jgi:hypothetical protein
MNIKKFIREEIDSFDWAEEWIEDTPTVGQEYYWDYDMGDGPVLVRVIGVHGDTIRFKILDTRFVQDNREMFYDDEYGWDPTDSIGIEGFMEMAKKNIKEDFDWTKSIPAGPNTSKPMTWEQIVEFLKERFKGTRFAVDVEYQDSDDILISLVDNTGVYDDFWSSEVDTLGPIMDNIKYTCDNSNDVNIRNEYRELYNAIMGYEYYVLDEVS